MERLSKRGHEIRVIDFEILWRARDEWSLISERQVFENVHKAINDGAVKVIRPPIVKMPALDYLSLIYTHHNEIQRQINEFKPDVIVGFGILNANIAIRLAKKNSIPFVYYIIDELHRLVPEKTFQAFAKLIESQNMKRADKVLSINEGLREYTIQMGASKEKTEVIRAGVDLDRFNFKNGKVIRELYGIKDNEIVLFFMGWLYDFSGLKEVALELGQYRDKRIKLMVIGKGDLWEDLQEIKNRFGLDKRLILIDWIPYEEVPKHLAASDICILPAYNNDVMRNIVPIKLYEYMAAGKPIIATNLPGVIKEFGFNNGITYINRSKDILIEAIKLLDAGSSEEGQKARRFIGKSNWQEITDNFEKTLIKLAKLKT